MHNATNRLTEEIVIRGIIDALRAHRYDMTPDERREIRDLLDPYVSPDVFTDIRVAVGYFDVHDDHDEIDPDPDLNAAADYLFAHLCATNLMAVGEALQLVIRGRVVESNYRRDLEEVDPIYRFSRCPRLVG